MTPRCDNCNTDAKLVSGGKVYPHRPDLFGKFFWICETCDARVGCHPGTHRALGKLATGEQRKARMYAHASFDPVWKSGRMKRKAAYAWLAQQVGVSKDNCHIGMFNPEQCARVVSACSELASADKGQNQ
jgi:zinc-finger-containing domain